MYGVHPTQAGHWPGKPSCSVRLAAVVAISPEDAIRKAIKRTQICLQSKFTQLLWSDVTVECDFPLTIWSIRTSLRHQPSYHLGGVVRPPDLSCHFLCVQPILDIICWDRSRTRFRIILKSTTLLNINTSIPSSSQTF